MIFMSEEELVDKILRSTSEGMTIAIDLYGGAVKKICMSILEG